MTAKHPGRTPAQRRVLDGIGCGPSSLPNHRGAFFGDHDGWRVGVGGCHGGHYRGIDHPQPL